MILEQAKSHWICILTKRYNLHDAEPQPPAQHLAAVAGEFDQILRENALFFDMLVSFSFTAGVAEPAWGCDVKNINLNLITRADRDPQGHQIVRVRVAGVVRSNNNVELNLLDEYGNLVGQGFYGYDSGQLNFYDWNGRIIITGYIDSEGNFFLNDQRLPEGKQDLAQGFVDPCFYCGALEYGWYDGPGAQVGGGLMFPTFFLDDTSRVRMNWSFEAGSLSPGQPAYGASPPTRSIGSPSKSCRVSIRSARERAPASISITTGSVTAASLSERSSVPSARWTGLPVRRRSSTPADVSGKTINGRPTSPRRRSPSAPRR